jgi:hypothetical protein
MKTQKKTAEKTVAHRQTKTFRGANLSFTPPTRSSGEVNDAELEYKQKRIRFAPSTLQVIESQIDAKKKEIDQDLERAKLAAWNATAAAITADHSIYGERAKRTKSRRK